MQSPSPASQASARLLHDYAGKRAPPAWLLLAISRPWRCILMRRRRLHRQDTPVQLLAALGSRSLYYDWLQARTNPGRTWLFPLDAPRLLPAFESICAIPSRPALADPFGSPAQPLNVRLRRRASSTRSGKPHRVNLLGDRAIVYQSGEIEVSGVVAPHHHGCDQKPGTGNGRH